MTEIKARFKITAVSDTGTLLRVINLFAKRGLDPTLVHATKKGEHLTIDVIQPNLPAETAYVIAAAARALVMVREVLLTCDPPAVDQERLLLIADTLLR